MGLDTDFILCSWCLLLVFRAGFGCFVKACFSVVVVGYCYLWVVICLRSLFIFDEFDCLYVMLLCWIGCFVGFG